MLNEWSTIDSIKKISPDWKIVPLQKFSSSDKNSFVNGPFGSDLLSSELVDEGHPVIYVRDIKDGRYQRKSGVCVTTEKHQALSACQVNYGDVVIAKVGDPPCEAAVYDVNESGVVTQDVIRIKTAEFGRSQFLAFLLNSDIGKRQVKRIKIAGTRERVSLTDFKKLKLPFPPVSEQNRIAQILFTWDQAIATTERLLGLTRQQKKALMQQLLTGKKRLVDKNGVKFQGEWHRTELGELLDYKQPTPYLVESTEYRDEYKTPVLTAGKTFILGYTDETSGIYQEELPAIIFDDFTTDSKFVDFPFKAKSSAMKILVAKKGVSIKYVFEAMQMLSFAVGGHQRHWISIFSNLVIPIPSKEEQEKIASVLSAADQEIETLQSQLEGLKQEKKALMQQLLTGKRRVLVS